MNTLTYTINNNLYLNITNSCTNDCLFCIRHKPKAFNEQFDLWLDHEPSAHELLQAIQHPENYHEIVFCGYGEPLIRLDIVKQIATYLKTKNCLIRIDTNGTGNLIHKRDITPELEGLIDTVSISLNAHNATLYNKLCLPTYGEQTFDAVIEFATRCTQYIPHVQFTLVEMPEVDLPACQRIADQIGVELKIRKYYEQDYAGFK